MQLPPVEVITTKDKDGDVTVFVAFVWYEAEGYLMTGDDLHDNRPNYANVIDKAEIVSRQPYVVDSTPGSENTV